MDVWNPHCSELYHHGIKGQKWGVRRWQNSDGTLTEAGREHYGYGDKRMRSEKQGTSDVSTNSKTKKSGLNLTEDQKKTLKRTLAVAGAITLTAAAVYATPRIVDFVAQNADTVIKAGTAVGHVGNGAIDPLDKQLLYVAQQSDRNAYRGLWGNGKNDYDMVANNNMKIAGRSKGKKVLANYIKTMSKDQLLEQAKLFREQADAMESLYGPSEQTRKLREARVALLDHYDGKPANLEKAYDGFNIALVNMGHQTNHNTKKTLSGFKEAMRNAGYAGVKDINDQKFSGFDTRSAKILFDAKKDLSIQGSRKLNSADNAIDRMKWRNREATRKFVKNTLPKQMVIGGAALGGMAAINAKNQSDMRNMKERGYSNAEIAKKYGITESGVNYYLYGKKK